MSQPNKHLAQLNVGRLRYPKEDPRVAGFVDNLDRVNALAERSEGFVWRLKDKSGNAMSIRAFEDPTLIPNLSVWTSAEALEQFVWQTIHKQFYGRRTEWFEASRETHNVMWWIPADHIPTLEEADERLRHIQKFGPTEFAFGWDRAPGAKLWSTAQCA